jgi:hypothetical protein
LATQSELNAIWREEELNWLSSMIGSSIWWTGQAAAAFAVDGKPLLQHSLFPIPQSFITQTNGLSTQTWLLIHKTVKWKKNNIFSYLLPLLLLSFL